MTVCYFRPSDTSRVRRWWIANFMQLIVNKTRVISFSPSPSSTCLALITNCVNTDCIIGLGVLTDSKLYFHHQVDSIFSQTIRLLGLIRRVTISFSSLECLLMLYCTVKVPICLCYVEHHYFYWCKTEHNQLKFLSLCHRRIFNNIEHNYVNVPNYKKFHTLSVHRRHLEALFFLN